MPSTTKDKAKKADAPAKEKPAVVVPSEITFTDDKRAQYARLVTFNYLVDNPKVYGVKKGEHDVNSVPKAVLTKAARDLAGGTLLKGKEGLELIKTYSANGSTTGRALTDAYASEVRPFIKKLMLSEAFGRRGGLTDEEKTEREEKRKAEAAEKAKKAEEKKAEREKAAAEKKAKKDKEASEQAAAAKGK